MPPRGHASERKPRLLQINNCFSWRPVCFGSDGLWLRGAVERGGHGPVGIHVFDEAAERSDGRGESGPRAGDGGGALDRVAVSRDAAEAEADAGGNQRNGDRRQILPVNDGRVIVSGAGAEVALGRTGN